MINIDLIIISLFLVLTFLIGIYYGKGITTFHDYAVGNRKMSTTVITLSLIATIYGGNILYAGLDAYYRQGLNAFMKDLRDPIRTYIASRFIIFRMKEFKNHLSIAESMGSLYGPTIRVITAIFGILMSIAVLTAQIKVGLKITHSLFPHITHVPTSVTIAILAVLVISYSTFGGARAVVLTDVYQFLLFSLCLPILIFVLLCYANNITSDWSTLSHLPQFNMETLLLWKSSLKECLYFISYAIFKFNPAGTQRFYMASSVHQAAKVFSKTALIRILFSLLFLGVAIALHMGKYTILPNQNVLNYIIQFTQFPGMKGILVTAMFALLMSTADSYLHAASVLFTNDIWPIIAISTNRIGNPSLKIVRISSVCIGITSIFIVYHTTNIIQLINHAITLYTPAVTIPFVMACCGFRPRATAVLLSIGMNTIITGYHIFCKNQMIPQQNVLESMGYSILILLISHYLLPKIPNTGWIGIKDSSAWDLQNQETRRWWHERGKQIRTLFTKKHRENFFPTKESTFILLGIYIIMNTIVALFFIQKHYLSSYIYSYMMIMAMGTLLAIYPALHSYRKKGSPMLHWVWPILLLVLLFIMPMQFARLSHYTPMGYALLICSLSFAIVLLTLEISILMFFIALLICNFIPPHIQFWEPFYASYAKATSVECLMATVLITATIVGCTIYKRVLGRSNIRLQVIELTRTYEHRISLETMYNQAYWFRLDATYGSNLLEEMSKMLQEPYDYLHTHGQEALGKHISAFITKLKKIGTLLQYRANEERHLKLNKQSVKKIAIEPAILKVHSTIKKLGEPMHLLLRNQTNIQQLIADPELFEYFLLLNIWEMSKNPQATDHMIYLTIANTTLQYDDNSIILSDNQKLTLPALAFWFSTDATIKYTLPTYAIKNILTSTHIPLTENKLYQEESSQIVTSHGGYVKIIETQYDLTCLYVWPVAGKKVMRFKTYDPMQLNSMIRETPESIAQEQELITLITNQTIIPKENVEKTISFIKNAHGLVSRKSGVPYYTHPMEVAKILLEVTHDPAAILTGLLHDIVEDTPITIMQIEVMYGSEIAHMVSMLTHYNTKGYPWKLDEQKNKSMLDQCNDVRIVYIKLADRLHNIRTLSAHKVIKQKQIARETIEFYIPWGEKNNAPAQWLSEMQVICEKVLKK